MLTQKEVFAALAEGKSVRDRTGRIFYFDEKGQLWYYYANGRDEARSWTLTDIEEVVG